MARLLSSILVVVCAIAALPQGQEPDRSRPAPPPANAPALPTVDEPFVAPVPRLDLPMHFTPRDRLEGFWIVRQRSVGGQMVQPGRGMLAIGRTNMVAEFEVPGLNVGRPMVRAGAYTWKRRGGTDQLSLVVLSSYYNDTGGDMHAEEPGTMQVRRFELLADALRVHQGGGDWIEFVRVE